MDFLFVFLLISKSISSNITLREKFSLYIDAVKLQFGFRHCSSDPPVLGVILVFSAATHLRKTAHSSMLPPAAE